MSHRLTRRDFAIRTAGFGLAMGLAPAATRAEAEQPSRSHTSPPVVDPYSLVDPELLPALKHSPPLTYQRRWSGSSGKCPACPRFLLPRRRPWSGVHPGSVIMKPPPCLWKQQRLALLRRRRIKGSPVVGMRDPVEHLTQLVVAVQRWSDGTEGH